MHPTPEEQLQVILRNIEQVATDPGLGPESREALGDAQRLVRRLERSWARRLPFLLLDNRLAVELLRDLAPLPADLADEIEAAAGEHASMAGDNIDEPTIHELNKLLQRLLGRAVQALPDDAAGDAGRHRIAEHLRSRLGADPTLNREPTNRLPNQEPHR